LYQLAGIKNLAFHDNSVNAQKQYSNYDKLKKEFKPLFSLCSRNLLRDMVDLQWLLLHMEVKGHKSYFCGCYFRALNQNAKFTKINSKLNKCTIQYLAVALTIKAISI